METGDLAEITRLILILGAGLVAWAREERGKREEKPDKSFVIERKRVETETYTIRVR